MAQVFELVKNSLRAVNDRYHDSDDIAPPVQVVVAEGSEDVTIKVHPRSQPHTCANASISIWEGLNPAPTKLCLDNVKSLRSGFTSRDWKLAEFPNSFRVVSHEQSDVVRLAIVLAGLG